MERRIIARNQHANDENREKVKNRDSGEHFLAGSRDVLPRALRLGCSDRHTLDAGEGVDSVGHDFPEAEKLSPVSLCNVCDQRTRIVPIPKSKSLLARYHAEIDHKTHDNDPDDQENLQESEEEFDFAVNANESNADQEGDDDEEGDPNSRVFVRPELNEDHSGRDLGRNTEVGPIHDVPAHSKSEGRVNEELCMADE